MPEEAPLTYSTTHKVKTHLRCSCSPEQLPFSPAPHSNGVCGGQSVNSSPVSLHPCRQGLPTLQLPTPLRSKRVPLLGVSISAVTRSSLGCCLQTNIFLIPSLKNKIVVDVAITPACTHTFNHTCLLTSFTFLLWPPSCPRS